MHFFPLSENALFQLGEAAFAERARGALDRRAARVRSSRRSSIGGWSEEWGARPRLGAQNCMKNFHASSAIHGRPSVLSCPPLNVQAFVGVLGLQPSKA